MKHLLAEFSRLHFPRPPATPRQIAAVEARLGWELDPDLRDFYLHSDGGTLFKPLPNANYCFLSLDEIERARLAIRGSDEDQDGAPSQYTLVDLQDTNFVILDVAQRTDERYALLDAFHETYPEVERIASSFGEFLEKALRSGDRYFWLNGSPPVD
ncbi:SMI1/KNR4 family protein [Corallococcus sp. bb12-1]|uniref:SMI1/KNR4 family protein n=1 Tax=Corallococcus sp. bb12-1 TaxID=2996784 RepID=UPI002D1E45F2|nr:SMI1/KNR4 family protein [Corallococcus sp. bb12-1]